MQFNLLKIKEIVKSSGLTPSEQEEFLSLLAKTSNRELDVVLGVFKEDPSWIEKFYKNYQAKKKAIKKKDKTAWRELLQEEYNTLRQIETLDY